MTDSLSRQDMPDDFNGPSVVDVVCGYVAEQRGEYHGKSRVGIRSILLDVREGLAHLDVADRDVFAGWIRGTQ